MGNMRFADWLHDERYTCIAFSRLLTGLGGRRISSRAVEKWRQGRTVPEARNAELIRQATKGRVTPNDFHRAHMEFVARESAASPPQPHGEPHA